VQYGRIEKLRLLYSIKRDTIHVCYYYSLLVVVVIVGGDSIYSSVLTFVWY